MVYLLGIARYSQQSCEGWFQGGWGRTETHAANGIAFSPKSVVGGTAWDDMHLIVQQGSEDGIPQVEVWTACIARFSWQEHFLLHGQRGAVQCAPVLYGTYGQTGSFFFPQRLL